MSATFREHSEAAFRRFHDAFPDEARFAIHNEGRASQRLSVGVYRKVGEREFGHAWGFAPAVRVTDADIDRVIEMARPMVAGWPT